MDSTTGQATDGDTIQRMRFACYINKAADTHPEYVILTAFPPEGLLRENGQLDTHSYAYP